MRKGFRETLIGYILICIANYFFAPDDPAFLKFSLHPYLALTLLFAVRYGVWEGALAGTLGAGLVVGAFFYEEQGLLIDFLFDFKSLSLPLSLIILGVLVGEATESRNKKLNFFRDSLSRERVQMHKISRSNDAMQKTLVELEKRLAGRGMGVQDFSEALLSLFAGDTDDLYKRVQELLDKYVHVEKSFLLVAKKDIYHLEPRSIDDEIPSDEELAAIQSSRIYGESLYTRKPFSMTNFMEEDAQVIDKSPVFFCGPIIGQDNEIKCIVVVNKIPFIHFNITNFRIFEVILDAASIGLQKIQIQEKYLNATPYHERWMVERETFFVKDLIDTIESRQHIKLLMFGYTFSDMVSDVQEEGFLTLLSQLCMKEGVRIGFIERAQCFVCYGTESDEALENLDIPSRYEKYGFSQALAELIGHELEMNLQDIKREPTYVRQWLARQFEEKREPLVGA